MEIMNEDTNFLQMIIKIFPWIYDIHREFLRSFPGDYEEHSLNQLNKKILEELQEISSCCTSERTKYLFETLGYFYKHFCWKVKWNMSSQFMQATCVRLLSNLIKVGAFLIQGNVESPWLNRILAAIKVFPGPNDHLFNAILYVNILKKKHLNVYRVILRTVLCSNYLTVKEPIEYLKVIVLFRRLKSLIKDPIWNIEINSAFARIKAPKSLKSWLLAHNFKVFCNVEQKIIIKKLMNKSLDKVLFRRLLEIILPEINLKKSSSKNKNKMNFGGSDKFTIDNTGLAQTEPEMILSVNSESSEFIPPIVKKTKKKRKLNISLGQENAMTKSTNVGKEISVLNDLAEKKSRKKKTKLLNENSSKNMNCSCSDLLVIDNTGLLQAESETILSDNNESSEIIPCILKKTKKRKLNIAFGQENAMIKSTNVENELSMSYDHAKKERRKKTKKISLHGVDNIQTQNDVTLCDIQDNSLTSSIVKIDCSKPETKLFVEMTNKEKLTEITSKQIYSNDVLSLSDSDDCKIIYTSHSSDHEGHSSENKTSKIKSPSICILNKNHSIVVNESKTTEDISNMEREMSYKKEETIIGIEIKTSDDISLSNLHDINNDLVGQELCVPGEKEHVSDTRKQIKDSNNYESLLETTLQESSPEQMQITTNSTNLVETENCSPTVNEKEFKNVLDGDVNELSDSVDNSNLQKETRNELTVTHEMEVVTNISESIELCHKHTSPVLAASLGMDKNQSIVANGSKTSELISNLEKEMPYQKENFNSETIIGIEIKTSDDTSMSSLHDIKDGLVGQEQPGEKEHITDSRKSIEDSNNYESLHETSLQENSPKQIQASSKSAVLQETEKSSPSVVENVVDLDVNMVSNSIGISNNQIETKDVFTENHEKKDKEVDINILESVGLCRKQTIPVVVASSEKNLINHYIHNKLKLSGEKEHIPHSRNSIIDSNNYESLLETTLQESSPEQMQITTKSADLVEIENCSPTVNEKEFKSVLDGGVNELSDSLDNSNLQKGTKDEFTDKHDRKNKEVVINIPESIELCHKHTIPVLAESHKKPLLNDDIGNKLISAKSSKNIMGIKSDNCSIEIIESGHNIVESNSDQVIEDYALKNVSLSSDLIIVENSCENQIKSIEQSTKDMSSVEIRTETHPSVTVGYIMEKMLNHLERAEHAVEDCSFESSKHNIFKSSIKITPDISFSSSVIKDSNSESSLLKKDRNHLSFLDFSSGKSKSPNKPENIENLASKVSEFYIYRDMVHDIDDNKSEDTLSESQITDKVDTNECLSNYCSYNSSDSELDKSDDNCNPSISLADDVCIDYNSCDSPDKFCVKNNIPDPFEHGFISSIKRKVDVENETNTKIQGICISGKNDNNGIEEYSPASKEISTMKSVKCILKKLSPVVHMGEKCDLKDLSENNYKMLKNCSDSAPEFNFKSENDNKLCDLENPIPQENQIEDYDQYIKKVENNPKMPWIVLRDIRHVEEPFSPKTDTSKSLLHHINNQIKSNLSNKEINSSTNSDNIKDQIDSYSTELNGHNIIEPSLGMKLRERTYQTTFVKKSASILEEALTESSIEKETKTPVKLACRMSLRNGNATSSCTSSGIKQNEKRMQKKEINQSLGLEFSELSLDSPKSKRKIFNESSVKNTSEELKDPVVIDSEIQSQSAVLNREMEVCRRSIRTSTAVSMKVDNSQNTSNQEIDSGGYHLRSRKSIVMPGKLKL